MDLQRQLEWLMSDADENRAPMTEAECRIAALTGTERTHWHDVRNKHFATGINKDSLTAIEHAICVVHIFCFIGNWVALAFSLRFWQKMEQFLSNCPVSDWNFSIAYFG